MSPEHRPRMFLAIIVILALALRFYGINWDQGLHLHPDERMLIMVATPMRFFANLNPDFFNYGSLPIYLLVATGQLVEFITSSDYSSYDGLLVVGRFLSALADTVTVVLIYRLARKLFHQTSIGLFAAFCYALFFFPIQNAHFFTVDVFLTMIAALLVLLLLGYLEQPTMIGLMKLSIASAAAVTTKISALIFFPIIAAGIILPHIQSRKPRVVLLFFSSFVLLTVLFTFLFMPYAFILPYRQVIANCGSVLSFINVTCPIAVEQLPVVRDILLQMKMNSDPFIFPYTLQYVGTTPYWYYLKNIFFWGMGPVFSVVSLMGLIRLIRHMRLIKEKPEVALMIFFYLLYFLVIGRSAVKFMRYMLPLYPAFALLTGYALYRISEFRIQNSEFVNRYVPRTITAVLLLVALFWTSMFMSIYSREHTRITASKWIYENIPSGSTLAVEHWDDRLPLPLAQQSTFRFEELALYEPDTDKKWSYINQQLEISDYIIIASNRLYIPLTKLTQCEKLPPGKCFPITAQYYHELFNGKRGFTKVAEFSSYPHLSIDGLPARNAFGLRWPAWRLTFYDDNADESFTVYDHPKVMVFQKNM